jgi:hypothetical protein
MMEAYSDQYDGLRTDALGEYLKEFLKTNIPCACMPQAEGITTLRAFRDDKEN